MIFKHLQHNLRIFTFSVKMALRSMRFRAFRTLLTVLGISIGIMTFVALMSIGIGMERQISTLVLQFMGGGMIVNSKLSSSRPSIPQEVGTYFKQISGVNDCVGLIEDFVSVRGEYLSLGGVPPDKLHVAYGVSIVRGHDLIWAVAEGVENPLLLDETASRLLGYDINDTILVSSLMSGQFYEFEIVGITSGFQIDISFILAGFAYTTLELMQEVMVTDNVQRFMVTVEAGYEMSVIADAIRNAYPEAEVITSEDILAMANQINDMIFAVLFAIGSISLLVGALMITNTTMMSVIERTREIGIVKAIGGKRSHVLMIFITEAVFIASVGGILGCIFSIAAVTGLTGIVKAAYGFPLAYSLEAWIFIAGMGMAGGIGAAAGAFPSWRAASTKPVEALRYE
ncbi:MAG: ABC transporter permease [Promethearchaeota archaeon]|nr:MAG: ABC transporter permease [Candidatus Lokiarchaeota archaeon]